MQPFITPYLCPSFGEEKSYRGISAQNIQETRLRLFESWRVIPNNLASESSFLYEIWEAAFSLNSFTKLGNAWDKIWANSLLKI